MTFEPTYEFLEDNLLVVMHDDGRYHYDQATMIMRDRLSSLGLSFPNDWYLDDKEHDAFVIAFKFRTTEAFTMAKMILL